MAKKLYTKASMPGCERFIDDSNDILLDKFYDNF